MKRIECADCKWFDRMDHSYPEKGECHLLPPIYVEQDWVYPRAYTSDFCSKAELTDKIQDLNSQTQSALQPQITVLMPPAVEKDTYDDIPF